MGLAWLTHLYHQYVESGSYVCVATTYLLHLIDNTIFVNKSSTHVHVALLQYFNNLDAFHKYAWGVATLEYLYNNLSYTSQVWQQAV